MTPRPLAITMGNPAGIGLEIIVKAAAELRPPSTSLARGSPTRAAWWRQLNTPNAWPPDEAAGGNLAREHGGWRGDDGRSSIRPLKSASRGAATFRRVNQISEPDSDVSRFHGTCATHQREDPC